MPDAQPEAVGGPLPRGHLLALNRSFRRTLEAENKSPRTVEAYTDAVPFLARYREAHPPPPPDTRKQDPPDRPGLPRPRPVPRPLLRGTRQAAPRPPAPTRAHPGLHRRPARSLEAGHRPQPLPECARLLQVGGRRARPSGQPPRR